MDNDIKELKNKVLIKAEVNADQDELVFITSEFKKYKFYHEQDCCESVSIESIVGDLGDLVGETLVIAAEVSNSDQEENDSEGTWTFYKFATIKGYVDVRWFGSSNGYYSESVHFSEQEVTQDEKQTYLATQERKLLNQEVSHASNLNKTVLKI